MTEAPPPHKSFFERHAAKLVVSVLLGAGLTWILARGGLPLFPPEGAFDHLAWWAIPSFAGIVIAAHFPRAARWRHLLRPVGDVSLRSIMAVSWVSFAIILMAPLRSGEVVRPYLITKRGTVKLWQATGTIGAERVIDGLVLSLILFAGLSLSTPLSPLPDHVGDLAVPVATVPRAAYGVLVLFACAFATMAIFFWRRDFSRRVVRAVVGVFSKRLAEVLSSVVERVAEGLRFLPSMRLLVPFMLETLSYWGALAVGTFVLARGAGLDEITLAQACVTMGCIGIGILVPSGPGFFGAFQLSAFMALAMFFHEDMLRGPGAAFVFLYYVIQVAWHLIAAAIGMIVDPRARPDGHAGETVRETFHEAQAEQTE